MTTKDELLAGTASQPTPSSEVAAPDNTGSSNKPTPEPGSPTPQAPRVEQGAGLPDDEEAALDQADQDRFAGRFAGPGAAGFRNGNLKLPHEEARDRGRGQPPVVSHPRVTKAEA